MYNFQTVTGLTPYLFIPNRVALVTDIVHTLHRAQEVVTSCEKVLTLHGKMPGDMDKHQDHWDKLQVGLFIHCSGPFHNIKSVMV